MHDSRGIGIVNFTISLALSAGTLMASAGTPYRLVPAHFYPLDRRVPSHATDVQAHVAVPDELRLVSQIRVESPTTNWRRSRIDARPTVLPRHVRRATPHALPR